jgi:hypothetical protein
MYEKINAEILEVKEQLRKKERIDSLLQRAKEHLDSEKQREAELKKVLEKEEMDVKKLEHLSFKALVLKVLGSMEEKMDKEKREFIAAKLKYDECCNSIKLTEAEIGDYKMQLREVLNAESDYEALIEKKEELILQSKDKNSSEILSLMEESADLNSDITELIEALNAGSTVLSSLESAKESLKQAEDWGTFDIFGGGFISSSAKHSSIDEAVEYINAAMNNLNRFRRELSDVNLDIDISIDIDSFDRFADIFFDNIFTDIDVQDKIESSLENVTTSIDSVKYMMKKLKGECEAKEVNLKDMKLKIKNIIEETRD